MLNMLWTLCNAKLASDLPCLAWKRVCVRLKYDLASTIHSPDVVMIGFGQLLTRVPQCLEPLVLVLDAGKLTGKSH